MDANVVAAIAAVVSAIGGAAAALAAFRSAGSAKTAQQSADEAERRGVLRALVLAAKELEIEAEGCHESSSKAARARDDLAVFTGNVGSSRQKLDKDAYAAKDARAGEIEREAQLFSAWPSSLEKAPLEEVDRVLTKLLALRTEAVAIRRSLDASCADLERQNDVFRKEVVARWKQ